MPVPEFIADLRARIGHDPLWLIGTTAVVIRGGSEVLLIERADNGCWTPVTGIVDPGEEPADAAVREVAEETGATAVPTRLAWVHATAPVVHANGDRAQYLDHVFLMDWVAGEPRPDGEESTAAGWFRLDALPQMSARMRDRIAAARSDRGQTRFEWSGPAG
ncbi:NUDIX hydrolase [Mycobacterium talmoniae]|uniref:ADP-ribose pyrophosphatase n=1 Tax=Mycobacterium talmoniae TaxID=1858794 RepID=A0A1S1NF06_9MYCO|nr:MULTISPECIES: NUDIX domain-containing protein [Mycobacterium]OHU97371.1 ADP-ribose pyrophosphatase [Mycobacterium talmoniae]TDH57636.1 NUDIX domain-containing protein [Mycobacterium eburneum]